WVALGKSLDVLGELGRQVRRAELDDGDRGARDEQLVERRDVDRKMLHPVRVLEPAFRDAARHRHLTTLEREPRAVVSGPCLLALHALAGRLAFTRAAAAAEPLLLAGCAGCGVQIMERDRHGALFCSGPGAAGIWRRKAV